MAYLFMGFLRIIIKKSLKKLVKTKISCFNFGCFEWFLHKYITIFTKEMQHFAVEVGTISQKSNMFSYKFFPWDIFLLM